MQLLTLALAGLGVALLFVAVAHSACVLGATWRWHWAARDATSPMLNCPPVSIFKPLCGDEQGLYANLQSFCTLEYPTYELIFGVQHASDPALETVAQLVREYPNVRIRTVVDGRQHGPNRKVSNLCNMTEHACHDVWVIADSDAKVSAGYLSAVISPLQNPDVGLVTCPYHDLPGENLWSRLAAMYVNDWFMPSVILAWALGHRDYVSGQTICVHRETIDSIGGFAVLGSHLADDYLLGELVRRRGKRIVMSHYVPQARHHEHSLSSLLHHEVRWMRTIAVLKPGSFRLLFLSFALPLSATGLALASTHPPMLGLARGLTLVVLLLRLVVHSSAQRATFRSVLRDVWLIPVRDALLAYVWARALRASRVTWRGVEFRVENDGILHATAEHTA